VVTWIFAAKARFILGIVQDCQLGLGLKFFLGPMPLMAADRRSMFDPRYPLSSSAFPQRDPRASLASIRPAVNCFSIGESL
jgi:hypothetical protein